MNPMLLALLQLINTQQTQQQTPLMTLLSGLQPQELTQQLLALFNANTTPPQSNMFNQQLLPRLLGQQTGTNHNGTFNQLMQMLGYPDPQAPSGNAELSTLIDLLQGKHKEKTLEEQLSEWLKIGEHKSPDKENEEDVVTRLQKQFQKKNEQADSEADLAEAIEFALKYDRFIEDHEDMLPDWFNANEVKEDVDKWAKTPIERSQGLAAATVRAFFKNESMLDLLEERDRKAVKDKILKDGLKSHEIERKTAWPLVERAIFNKTKLEEGGSEAKPSGKDETAIQDFGAIFEQGQKTLAPQDVVSISA